MAGSVETCSLLARRLSQYLRWRELLVRWRGRKDGRRRKSSDGVRRGPAWAGGGVTAATFPHRWQAETAGGTSALLNGGVAVGVACLLRRRFTTPARAPHYRALAI